MSIHSNLHLPAEVPASPDADRQDDLDTMTIVPVVEIIDEKPTTTSRHVAKFFGKRHDNVLRDIDNILMQVAEISIKLNFEGIEYAANVGSGVRKERMYRMDKDAFTLLAMGYTGPKAMQFKLAYIHRFNEMEKQLRSGLPDFTDPVVAARAWAEQLEAARKAEAVAHEAQFLAITAATQAEKLKEKTTELEQKIEKYWPLVEYAGSVSTSPTTITVGQTAKLFTQSSNFTCDVGEIRLNEILRNDGYLHTFGSQYNLPTQKNISAGLMQIEQIKCVALSGTRRRTRFSYRTRITGKGQIHILKKLHRMMKEGKLPCKTKK